MRSGIHSARGRAQPDSLPDVVTPICMRARRGTARVSSHLHVEMDDGRPILRAPASFFSPFLRSRDRSRVLLSCIVASQQLHSCPLHLLLSSITIELLVKHSYNETTRDLWCVSLASVVLLQQRRIGGYSPSLSTVFSSSSIRRGTVDGTGILVSWWWWWP